MNVRSDLPATEGGRVVAVLGPTNTGKTYLAIERMLGHRTGMIGFPLRLLARENYERIVAIKGKAAVALVTGEEKILPAHPAYWVCTVESMPLDRVVDFLAVDEIQLCADPERGHIFTDRLLHARGQVETMVLGSETIQPLIRRLVPRAEFVTRPRFSSLTYAGSRRLTRLPPRSAIVAFSATDVYALAETWRRQRGGTAVVLGALSPRTRNAQVGLYQSGEVDYLVATDAIGMGLNMDVDHVAFARMTKFDGFAPRRLRAPEVAQIAGRAGRHTRDGTFGTTEEVGELDEELIERVENHEFDKLTHVMWRNSELRFDTVGFLLKSLEARPAMPELIRVREADDHLALQVLARDPDVAPLARGISAVRQLWEVCQVPDFRKVLSDAHTRLLSRVYQHLMTGGHRLPTDWVAQQVANLDHVEGDIDALVARIAHVRTWTYISNRPAWLIDPGHWQERTRAIEDKLSDALHERLTQRFVDRRSAMLTRTLRGGGELLGAVRDNGEVIVEGHPVGRIEGFRFVPDAPARSEEARALLTAARRALHDEIARRLKELEDDADDAFALAPDGALAWHDLPVARLSAGDEVLSPGVVANDEALLDQPQRDRVRLRLERWVRDRIAARLKPLLGLRDIGTASGAARGLAFQLAEGLGFLRREPVEEMIRALTAEDRKILTRHGVRIAPGHVHMPVLAKPAAVELRALLWAVHAGAALPAPVPPGGRVSVAAASPPPPAYWDAIGYPLAGPRAIRADMLDRFVTGVAAIKDGAPEAFHALGRPIGCSADEVDAVLTALGYRRAVSADGAVTWRRRKHRPHPARRSTKPVAADHPFAQLLRLTGTS